VDGSPTRAGAGETRRTFLVLVGRTHLGFRVNASPFAGRCGTGSLRGSRHVRDHAPRSGRGRCRLKGFHPSASGRATWRCAARGEKGPHHRQDDGPSLTSGRSGSPCFFGSARAPARRSRVPRKGSAPGERGAGRKRHPVSRSRTRLPVVRARASLRVAEVVRPPPGPEKRAFHVVRVKARASNRVRVNGDLVVDEDTARKRS